MKFTSEFNPEISESIITVDEGEDLLDNGSLIIKNGNNYAYVDYTGKVENTLSGCNLREGTSCMYPVGTYYIDELLRKHAQEIVSDTTKDNETRIRELSELLGWTDILSAYANSQYDEETGNKIGVLPDGTEIIFNPDDFEKYDTLLDEYYIRYDLCMRTI